jgi:hypothetical protein
LYTRYMIVERLVRGQRMPVEIASRLT